MQVEELHQQFSTACETALRHYGYKVEVVGVGSTSRGTHDPTGDIDFDFNVRNRALFNRFKENQIFLRQFESSLAETLDATVIRPCELNTKDKQLGVAILQGGRYSVDDVGRFTFKFRPGVRSDANIDFSVGASDFFRARGIGYAKWFSQQEEHLVVGLRATVANLKSLRGAESPLRGGIGVESLAWQCGAPFEDVTILNGKPYFIRHTPPSLELVSQTIKRIVGRDDGLDGECVPSSVWHICFLVGRVRTFHDVLNCKRRGAWRTLNTQIDTLSSS